MKALVLVCISAVLIIGCQKQPEQAQESASQQFQKVDEKITVFLDILDNPDTSKDQQIQVLCKDYPHVYEKEYIPALLKLSKDSTEKSLLNDLKMSTDYYKQKLGIICE